MRDTHCIFVLGLEHLFGANVYQTYMLVSCWAAPNPTIYLEHVGLSQLDWRDLAVFSGIGAGNRVHGLF